MSQAGSIYHMSTFNGELKPDQIKVKLKKFLKEYYVGNYQYKYREQLRDHFNLGEYWITVDLEDLDAFDEVISDRLRKSPIMLMEHFENAATEVCDEVTQPRSDDMERVPNIQVMITSCAIPTNLRDLQSTMVSQLVTVSGIVINASQIRNKATQLTLQCLGCRDLLAKVPVSRGLDGYTLPRKCHREDPAGKSKMSKCPLDPYHILPDKCKCVDIQTLKIQELPENTPQGTMPRHLKLYCDRFLCDKLVPGNRVTLFGTLAVVKQSRSTNPNNQGAEANFKVGLRSSYLQVIGYKIEVTGPGHTSSIPYTAEEEEEFKMLASDPNCYNRICASIAPYIHGFEDVKKAVATLLFSGSVKCFPDNTRRRGDINVLLLGDPGTAKSQILKFVEQVAPIGVYTSGKGSSAAGLTASVLKDASTRSFSIEGGAMVLADCGVVCIDEFDKMRESDRVAIHEAMEQQTISIAKAGITVTLNSRCAVLAAANSVHGKWDEYRSDEENIDFMPTILSRFDMIFVIKDKSNFEADLAKARHVVGIHAGIERGTNTVNGEDMDISIDFLKKYIAYCKSKIGPRVSEEAAKELVLKYVDMRNGPPSDLNTEDAARQKYEKKSIIPITVRQLEATIRISEALAKMELKPFATNRHIEEALRLFSESSLKASQSGHLTGAEGFMTDKDREIMVSVEKQIKRRLSFGLLIDEDRLLTEFINKKVDIHLIKLVIMQLVKTNILSRRNAPRGKLVCIMKDM